MPHTERCPCSECYDKGYWDAFDTIAEHFRKSQRFYSGHGEIIVFEILNLRKEEYSK